MSNGYVYAFSFNGKTKIGRAKRNPDKRIRALITQTGLIEGEYAFNLFYTGHHEKVEKHIHKMLKDKHISGEYFRIDLDTASVIVRENIMNEEAEKEITGISIESLFATQRDCEIKLMKSTNDDLFSFGCSFQYDGDKVILFYPNGNNITYDNAVLAVASEICSGAEFSDEHDSDVAEFIPSLNLFHRLSDIDEIYRHSVEMVLHGCRDVDEVLRSFHDKK